jgi:hypothetical protein
MNIEFELKGYLKAIGMMSVGMFLAIPTHAEVVITNISLNPDAVTLGGGGGPGHGDYVLLATDQVDVHPRGWTILSTNKFDAEGRFLATHPTGQETALEFYRVITVPTTELPDRDLIGFATLNGGTTGGAGGQIVTVSTPQEFRTHLVRAEPLTIQIEGPLDLGSSDARPTSNKTLLGLGDNATLTGNLILDGVTNVIIHNLHLTNPTGAGS